MAGSLWPSLGKIGNVLFFPEHQCNFFIFRDIKNRQHHCNQWVFWEFFDVSNSRLIFFSESFFGSNGLKFKKKIKIFIFYWLVTGFERRRVLHVIDMICIFFMLSKLNLHTFKDHITSIKSISWEKYWLAVSKSN